MKSIVPSAGEGRRYACGPLLTGVFKVDEEETEAGYSVSEWCIESGFEGVGARSHEANDEILWVAEGRPEVLADEAWREVAPGAFLHIPGSVTQVFRSRSDAPARLLNVFIPGGFERRMPAIADWFEGNG